jgi:nucleoside-diphosphate-sugar epimerase
MIVYSTFLSLPIGEVRWGFQSSPLGELEGALMQPGDVPRTEADVTDLVENLGYKPDTPVQNGIEKFIKWYKSYF